MLNDCTTSQTEGPNSILHVILRLALLTCIFRISNSVFLLQLKLEEISCAYDVVDKAGTEQARIDLLTPADVQMAQRTTGGRDTRFLRDEIRQLESHLERKEKELVQLEKEMSKERKTNEELSLRAEEAEDENKKLKRENEQLHQDVDFYRRELEQKDSLQTREESTDTQRRLNKASQQLYQCMEDLQHAEDMAANLKSENEHLQKNMEESVKEMEKMTDEYNKMKIVVQQTDAIVDQLRKERDQAKLQVRELTEQIQSRAEEDDPVMAAVSAKVEEWKNVLSEKDVEIMEYQQMIRDLREKLRAAHLDSDKSNIIALQQAVQERDHQIKLLSARVEQYTGEMEKNALLIEELKKPMKKEKGMHTSNSSMAWLQNKSWKILEWPLQLPDLNPVENRRSDMKTVVATRKRKNVKELETFAHKERTLQFLFIEIVALLFASLLLLGMNPKEEVDLTEFRRTKALKQRQYRAENQVLLKEVIRITVLSSSLLDDDADQHPSRSIRERPDFRASDEKIKQKNEYLQNQLNSREKELELKKAESSQLKARLNKTQKENQQLEQDMKEILQAIQAQSKSPSQIGISRIPSLERLISALEIKYSEGKVDIGTHLRFQLDQLTSRNEELKQELKAAREEAASTLSQLMKSSDKVVRLESEIEAVRLSAGAAVPQKTLPLPEESASSSVKTINSLNEYMVQLLQENKNKQDHNKMLGLALEEYKRKFAVIRHQQGLLYKEYQSEKESWQKERHSSAELKAKMEEQKEVDAVKIKEYNNWLEALEKDPVEMRRQVSEAARRTTVLRVNEKSLTRQYTTLLEQEQHLRKENNKLKEDFVQMETAVTKRIGYLQRFKEMAAFKMAALQKALDDSVPSFELERANKQYNDLTIKYRDLLQKDNYLVQRTTGLEHMENENVSLHEQINSVNKELEITKEKLHTLEQAWEHINDIGEESSINKAVKALANSEIVSVSKRITTLEMKELNERQRAEHAQKMYEHLRNSLKQVEERNLELEGRFAEMAKQNLEAQRIERELRDELADSVSKEVSDADRQHIAELEKSEAQLRIEVSKLREVSDVAKMQVSALEARRQSREKEVESLRRQVLDYQAQSDEKSLIAKLHQHIVALQLSETAAISKLEASTARLLKLEAQQLRAEQHLDAQQQALWHARQEGRQRARHLRHALQALRTQFSGALPLAQQEKFSNTMLQLQEAQQKARKDAQRIQEEHKMAEGRAQELELRLKSLEELMATIKDGKGAQKVSEWHKKLEEARLQELRKNRELGAQREEIRYLKNMIDEQERIISSLEEELVQQNNLQEERQLSWDHREVELERQLEAYDKQQRQIIGSAQKFEEATDSLPDPSQPLAHQLGQALSKIKEHVRTILETQAVCKTLEEKLKVKEAALWQAEQNVLARDRVINELRLRLPAAAERERLLADLSKQEDLNSQPALKIAHQTISNLQGRLDQKEEVLKKYQNLLVKARQEQEETSKKHDEEVRNLHQKLDLHTDKSLDHFRQTAQELMKKPTITVPTTKQLARLAELEQTVAEQDTSILSLTHKLKMLTAELEKQRQATASQAKDHTAQTAKLEERHASQMKAVSQEAEEHRSQVSQMEKELQYLRTELEAQKAANVRSPSNTMKNLVERLKAQLALKEKQQKALSKALLELRAEMTSHAEQQIIASAAQKEESLNIQQIVDKQTKDLKTHVKELSEELQSWKENVRAAKSRESSLKEELESLSRELQKSQKSQSRLQSERGALEEQVEELKQKVRRLHSGLQGQTESEIKGPSVETLQKKIRKLESELDKKSVSEPAERKTIVKDDKTSKEELVRWEEAKKWQAKVEKFQNHLKEKERQTDLLSKQLNTLKELYGRLEQEKAGLQKKLKSRGVTADQVVGARTVETDKEIESLKNRNCELEQQIEIMKLQQALPRDAAMEDINIRNRYLEERIYSLESQLKKDPFSRPSTSGRGSGTPSQREHELQKDNLRLSTENLELRFQLEQAIKDLPRLKHQVSDLKEMCDVLKKEKAEVEKKLGHGHGTGRSGKTVPELEKTIALMKKVVEKVQRENESLKKSSATTTQEQLTTLEREHEKFKAEYDKMKEKMDFHLTSRLDSKMKGMEKIVMENERLHKDIKKVSEALEKLRVENTSLVVKNKKLKAELDETTQKLLLAQSKGPSLERADGKSWKSTVVTRLYENKMKDLESEISKNKASISEFNLKLKESHEREKDAQRTIIQLKEQVELLKNTPIEGITEEGLAQQFQSNRLTINQLEREKTHLLHQIKNYEEQFETSRIGPGNKELQAQLNAANAERSHLQDEIRKMSNELANFDPTFFEELEDLKFNYNVEVKKNIILEEQLKKLSERFGVPVDIPTDGSLS
uniref:Centrosomal protein 290 n=1 Tax=Astyanax mexicanus TaxID=7994 RepID=A0A8B9GX56_ASTMX